MPLNSQVDGTQLMLAVISGATSAFFHYVRVRSGRTPPARAQLQAESAASFASGVLVSWALNMQPWWVVDPIGAFVASAVMGFTRGPAALFLADKIFAARFKLPEAKEDSTPPTPPPTEPMPTRDGDVRP